LTRSAALVLLLAGIAGPAAAQTPRPGIALAIDAAPPVRVTLAARDVLRDDDLEEAVRSGIPLRLRFRVELWRDRFFDRLEGARAWSATVVYDPLDRIFLVRRDGAPADAHAAGAVRYGTFDAVRAALETNYRPDLTPAAAGRFYFTALLEIETLSLSDLDELQRWLSGELQPAVSGGRAVTGAIGEGARRLAIRLLRLPTRRFETRTATFAHP
jgi:hypothetical protein